MNAPNETALLDHLNIVVKTFEEAKDKLLQVLEPVAFGCTRADLMTKLKCYLILDSLLDACKSVTTAANTHMPQIAEKVSNEMLANDMDSISAGGYKFTPGSKTYVSVSKENKPLVVEWLKKHPIGNELVSEDFNANALTSFINGLVTEQGYSKESDDPKLLIPATIGMFDKPTLTMRKVKK
jgi:hypothetical protein